MEKGCRRPLTQADFFPHPRSTFPTRADRPIGGQPTLAQLTTAGASFLFFSSTTASHHIPFAGGRSTATASHTPSVRACRSLLCGTSVHSFNTNTTPPFPSLRTESAQRAFISTIHFCHVQRRQATFGTQSSPLSSKRIVIKPAFVTPNTAAS